MIDDVVNNSTKTPSIEPGESGRNTYQGGNTTGVLIGAASQSKVLQYVEIGLTDNVVGFID